MVLNMLRDRDGTKERTRKTPPWLNPHTNMFLGFVPAASSLSIIACTFWTALSTPFSSFGESWCMFTTKNVTEEGKKKKNVYYSKESKILKFWTRERESKEKAETS